MDWDLNVTARPKTWEIPNLINQVVETVLPLLVRPARLISPDF